MAGRALPVGTAVATMMLLIFGCATAPLPTVSPAPISTPVTPTPMRTELPTPTRPPSPTATPSPTPTPSASPGLEISRGSFALDPAEHPGRESTSLRVLVAAQGCTDGQPPVIYGTPFIFYEKDTVSVIFSVLSVPEGVDCQTAPATSTTLALDEPLGNRVLWDLGGYREVFSPSHDLLVYWSDPLAEMATERVRLMAGPGSCESDLQGDRSPLTPEELRSILAEVGPNGGPADSGQAYVGGWLDAARFLGAVEAYQDGSIYKGMVAPASALGVTDPNPDGGSLVLTRLRSWYLTDGRQVWSPASLFNDYHDAKLFRSAPCEAG